MMVFNRSRSAPFTGGPTVLLVSSSRPLITADDHLAGMYRNSGLHTVLQAPVTGTARRQKVRVVLYIGRHDS